jgi:class III poly(R)-hydroxyalkanoic acid synthase PhaE subunit
MSAKNSSSTKWNDNWIESQRAYWEAWMHLSKQTMDTASTTTGSPAPWGEALEQWWKAIFPAVPEQSHDFLGRIVQQGKNFLSISEEFTRFSNTLAETKKAGGQWQDLWQGEMEKFKSIFAQSNPTDIAANMWNIFPFLELPVDTWTRTFASTSLLPGDFLGAFKSLSMEQSQNKFQGEMEKFLSVPGVGYTREWQEQSQHGARLLLDYQRALQAYQQIHSQFCLDGIDRFSKKVNELVERGEEITSLRQLYDLWVDCGEEAYNDFVFTEEYSACYGGLVNALMALKHHIQNVADEASGALNLPTRKGMTTVQHRQQELRRELATLRTQVRETANMQNEITKLREEMASLKSNVEAMLAAPAPVPIKTEEPKVLPEKPAALPPKTSRPSPAGARKSRTAKRI